jgi:hypothetical protein
MTQAEISGISPFFIVRHVPSALSFYRDRLGFEITFQGPAPDDVFFGIVCRGGAMIMLKDVGVEPLPNYKRDVKKGVGHRFKNGDTIRVGPIALAAHVTGGHTRGCTSWSFTVRDGERVLNVVSASSLVVLLGTRYPEQGADLERSFRVLQSLPPTSG